MEMEVVADVRLRMVALEGGIVEIVLVLMVIVLFLMLNRLRDQG